MPNPEAPLSDKIGTALSDSPYFTGRNLRFEAEEGRVTLRGQVQSYFQKQMAQESLRNMEGINEIHNELEVSTPHSRKATVTW